MHYATETVIASFECVNVIMSVNFWSLIMTFSQEEALKEAFFMLLFMMASTGKLCYPTLTRVSN